MKPQTGVSCEVFMLTTSRLHFGSRYCDGTHKHLVEVGGVWKWNFFDHLGVGLQDHGNLMKVGENCDVSMWCGKTESMHFYYFSLYILSIDRWSCNFHFESWILKCQQVDFWKHHCCVGRKEATGVSALCPQKSLGWRDVRVELQGFSIRVSNQMKIHFRILPRNSQGKADSGCLLLCHDMVTVRQETLLARLWWQS